MATTVVQITFEFELQWTGGKRGEVFEAEVLPAPRLVLALAQQLMKHRLIEFPWPVLIGVRQRGATGSVENSETFLTNHLKFGATTIACVYKERWQIELFFKSLKRLLRVKTFVGTSANAPKKQLWTALIAMLLLKYLHLKSTFNWPFPNLVALIRQQLFRLPRSQPGAPGAGWPA